MRKPLVLVVAALLLLGACSAGDEGSRAPTDEPTESSQSATTSVETPEPTAVPVMSLPDAQQWYSDALCIADTFVPARRAALALAETDQVNTEVFMEIAALDAVAVQEASAKLENPPAAWPNEVGSHVEERREQLEGLAAIIETLGEVETPAQFLSWFGKIQRSQEAAQQTFQVIRAGLDMPQRVECLATTDSRTEVEDPDVVRVVQALSESLTQVPAEPADATIECYGRGGSDDRVFANLSDYWLAVDDDWQVDFCSIELSDFDETALTPQQEEALALASDRFVDGLTAEAAYEYLLGNCVDDPRGGFGDMQAAQATLLFCPDTRYARLIEQYAQGARIDDDGSYVVGESISPGIWRTTDRVADCYWERTRSNGDIIDNGLVTFASSKVSVTISESDGSFTTQGCGSWKRES